MKGEAVNPGAVNPGVNARSGFTLIELLVALSLSMIVVTLTLQIISSSQTVTDRLVSQSSMLSTIQAAQGLIADDVRGASAIETDFGGTTQVAAALSTTTSNLSQLKLRKPPTALGCDATRVSYVRVKRSQMTSLNNRWLAVATQRASGTDERYALYRSEQCMIGIVEGPARIRLVADQLGGTEFQLSEQSSTNFTSSPDASRGIKAYQSVRVLMWGQQEGSRGVVRVPAAGTLSVTATSRAKDYYGGP